MRYFTDHERRIHVEEIEVGCNAPKKFSACPRPRGVAERGGMLN
jgi:hypothetical protein